MNDLDWARTPVLLALLNAILDRVEAQPFEARSRDLMFPLTARTWPAFFGIDAPAERAYQWRLFERLAAQPGFALRLDERRSARDLDVLERRPRLAVGPEAEAFLRAVTGREKGPRERWLEGWKATVAARYGDGPLARHLLARPLVVASQPPEAVLERLAGLADLVPDGLMLHEAASRQFWGLSKLLNGQQEAVALLLGRVECPFPNRPVQLVVQTLAGELAAPVLLVENAATFESLAAGRMPEANGHILVFASGYKASARRIRSPGGSSLYFSPRVHETHPGLPGAIEAWLYSADTDRPVYFWGDLDYAGMAILKDLRGVFPNARAWPPGYELLMERLRAGESHAPEEAAKTGQTDPVATGCEYADTVLLPALRRYGRFVDQESV